MYLGAVDEAKRRGLDCGVGSSPSTANAESKLATYPIQSELKRNLMRVAVSFVAGPHDIKME